MATVGLLALLDDIATLLDDIAVLSKVAAQKTAGVLGDDLALNAQQVSGVRADRELAVVWAVAKGSTVNKLILVPAALWLSAFIPWLITPLMILGGSYLCFEGFEKILHYFLHHDEKPQTNVAAQLSDPHFDLLSFENTKIKAAIRTDFILSAEIVVIVLGTVQQVDFLQQVVVVSLLAAAMTIGVYGLVAVIVKLDDLGLHLMQNSANKISVATGRGILKACPWLMKFLSIAGTAAMFLVGGGILVHGIPFLHQLYPAIQKISLLSTMPHWLLSTLFNGLIGICLGALVVCLVSLIKKLYQRGS